MSETMDTEAALARVNGQPLHRRGETLTADELRQRACTELLRQAAQASGLLDAGDLCGDDGVISEAATDAIERLLERELRLPEPDEAACRRHHAAHAAAYTVGERVHLRHVLFAVTPGVDVRALRARAEAMLLELRCTPQAFAARAAELSNCPSGEQGGDLGWLREGDCAPELAREVFGRAEVGVLARLVATRFGLHVIEVLQREAGSLQPYEAVEGAVRLALQQHAWATALRHTLLRLAGAARLEGVALDGSDSPLLQ
jgi:peptidyl-prolyl cis-trans isomerase C